VFYQKGEIEMNKIELLNELLKQPNNDVEDIFIKYIKQTKLYSQYIKLIVDISVFQQEDLSRKLTKTKMVTNAIQLYLNENIEINKNNWFVWMRYIDATEDSTTDLMNTLDPIWILKEIDQVLKEESIKLNNVNNNEYIYLINRFQELKKIYKL